ncbi:hypothetical protein F2P81_004636 [Scophthalmus maximus]|uniref:Secreted protein n=1 Tax=Scophthalmus maximus TaxID=52904 RepID=A0A6A4TEQ5_SCOMX|nr:hypothetical protein F2P81_004636 [Scophthalmus maximus]
MLLLLLLTLGLSAWCAPFCTSKAGTASCLCPADSQRASWALPGEALQREDAAFCYFHIYFDKLQLSSVILSQMSEMKAVAFTLAALKASRH